MMKKILIVLFLVSGLFAGSCENYSEKSIEQLDKVQRALKHKVSESIIQQEIKMNIYYLNKAIVNCEKTEKFIGVRDELQSWIK